MLRPHIQVVRQLYHGEPWYVVSDPISNSFFRLNPVAYHLVGLMDSKRTVDEVWRLTLERYGDTAPTQNEVIGLLGQLNQSNLLRVDLPADAEPLLRRANKRKMQHWGGQAMSILFIRIPLFNPDRILTWLLPLFRPLLNIWGLMLWATWMVFASWQFLPHLRVFLRDSQSILAPSNWGWMVALFIFTKVCHETGHGLVCKRFGGIVPEVGIMMLVLFPVPFVDATSSWNFPSKWRRLLVGGAGMIFELAIAGIAAIVWLYAEPESLTRQLSYNMVFMASVSTILFNANPLLKFDGYYMLSDILEIPNLYDRAKKHLQWLIQHYAYGMTNTHPVSSRLSEKIVLISYGISSMIYKVLVLFGIILFVSGQMYVLGILLAGWSLIAWAVVPLSKFFHWLATSPALHEHRARAITVTALFVIVVVGGIGAVPMPDHRRTVGMVESAKRVEIAIQTDGFIQEVRVEAGQSVQARQVILISDSPELRARYEQLQSQLQGLRSLLRQSLAEDIVAMKSAKAQIAAVSEELAQVKIRIDALVLRSPQSGVLVGGIMSQLVGQYAARGQVIAQVVDLSSVRVTALMDQAQNSILFDGSNAIESVELRTAGHLDEVLPSRLIGVFPSGRSELPHPALSHAGGGSIATRPDDPNGQMAMRPQFELWLELPATRPQYDQHIVAYPGQRVYVRLTLQRYTPLLYQWVHRLRQVFRETVNF